MGNGTNTYIDITREVEREGFKNGTGRRRGEKIYRNLF